MTCRWPDTARMLRSLLLIVGLLALVPVAATELTPQGTIVAADKNNHVIRFIDARGKLLLVLGDGLAGRGPNRFTTPEGVELSGSTLWLSDSGNDRIVKYRIDE
jgi:hypothetical protein